MAKSKNDKSSKGASVAKPKPGDIPGQTIIQKQSMIIGNLQTENLILQEINDSLNQEIQRLNAEISNMSKGK